jgi:hypothetical protein
MNAYWIAQHADFISAKALGITWRRIRLVRCVD